ncbi:3-keto-disaccharide hydrolase [Niabella hirudinis]|uniref:3-keto-disaccharide hydrolase n=1 Tax=Niabella hirudinis TaxID=1285929 RepID=UPI003EC0D62E
MKLFSTQSLLLAPAFMLLSAAAPRLSTHQPDPITVVKAKKSINLLDKKNASKWRGYNGKILPPDWTISDGMLWMNNEAKPDPAYKGGRDVIFTGQEFEYFELTVDWKIARGGNSGIFYHVKEGYGAPSSISPEYQLIDDENFAQMHPDLKDYNAQFGAKNPEQLQDWQKTGADYAMHPADEAAKVLHPVGQWNSTKIVVAPGRTEYWLNGVKLLSFEPWSADWYARKKAGKWAKSDLYGTLKTGYIGFQYHGSSLWFKNIMVKPL